MKDIGDFFKKTFEDRLRSPFYVTVFIGWCICNYQLIYATFFVDEYTIIGAYGNKLNYINSLIGNYGDQKLWKLLFEPVVYSILFYIVGQLVGGTITYFFMALSSRIRVWIRDLFDKHSNASNQTVYGINQLFIKMDFTLNEKISEAAKLQTERTKLLLQMSSIENNFPDDVRIYNDSNVTKACRVAFMKMYNEVVATAELTIRQKEEYSKWIGSDFYFSKSQDGK